MGEVILPVQHVTSSRGITRKVVVLSWLLVGTTDILAAFARFYINTGKQPIPPVSKFIASGVLGRPAFKGGPGMIALGLLFHYIIALLFTVFFFWLYKRWAVLSRNWLITGVAYGIFIWLVMSQLVVPLSNTPPAGEGRFVDKLTAILILVTMIGLPLAFIAKKVTGRTRY
ncbi:MAG TPA: hypothetical protein VD993_19700 [Chitinophagaceae bacterium]|nr:hypothetical protein [Chitinophagaceae bacterium]